MYCVIVEPHSSHDNYLRKDELRIESKFNIWASHWQCHKIIQNFFLIGLANGSNWTLNLPNTISPARVTICLTISVSTNQQ